MESKLQKKLLKELLEYTYHLANSSQRPVFNIKEHDSVLFWEHEFKGKVGIQHNIENDDGSVSWLSIKRLPRVSPPKPVDEIKDWLEISNDPGKKPNLNESIIKTLTEKEVDELLEKGLIDKSDINEPLKEEVVAQGLKDVVLRIEKNAYVKRRANDYLLKQWTPWAQSEKPRRETIKIYDSFFSLQQLIESQSEGSPIELVWGAGVSGWKCSDKEMNFPLIEQLVELEVTPFDGTILITPRNTSPYLQLSPFLALGVSGVSILSDFEKKHFSKLSKSERADFSPFIQETFEPVLRQAATCLSENGIYWPDKNPDIENRAPNLPADALEVTDSWVIFARRKSPVSLIQDIKNYQKTLDEIDIENIPAPTKKLVTGLSSEKTNEKHYSSDPGQPYLCAEDGQDAELFFPKPSNEAQEEIVKKLQSSIGVVVQGPPGTGKTHTIANIICHYLAAGKKILVTSKREPALSVLREQIPDGLRELTISLLTNEKDGMKQLEKTVQNLANIINKKSLKELIKEKEDTSKVVKELKNQIKRIDIEMHQWAEKQLAKVDKRLTNSEKVVSSLELAQEVVTNRSEYSWLPDLIDFSEEYSPQFLGSDIARIREARRGLGKDILYVGSFIPLPEDFPDAAMMAKLHDDLSQASSIADMAKKGELLLLSTSVDSAIARAKNLLNSLNFLVELFSFTKVNGWLTNFLHLWVKGDEVESLLRFESLLDELSSILSDEAALSDYQIVAENFEDHKEIILLGIKNLSDGKRPFGLLPFGKGEFKSIVANIRINGLKPSTTDQWEKVHQYFLLQDATASLITKWNYVGRQIGLPELHYKYGMLFSELDSIHQYSTKARVFLKDNYAGFLNEMTQLFPYGVNFQDGFLTEKETLRLIESINLNILRRDLQNKNVVIQDILSKLKEPKGPLPLEINKFVNEMVGKSGFSVESIVNNWQGLIKELKRLNGLKGYLSDVFDVATLVEESGAPQWAHQLKTSPLIGPVDEWTPVDWQKAWTWRQKESYLLYIDGRGRLKELSVNRKELDKKLKKTFVELIKVKTEIGLHRSVTEKMQGALMRFVSAIRKIGKGTGKRAPRHKKDAFNAMLDCYDGIPCWIMPTWRISENLPSEFGSFDLVIIDEASQSNILDLTAILRAKKILIVGDDKQVSPTAAFVSESNILQLKHNFLKHQPFGDSLYPDVSIYELARVLFPGNRIMLTEHFRCVEPIIRFSMQFYDEPLVPLRLPKASEKLTPPLVDVYVEGAERNRRDVNLEEARAIVDEIKQLSNDPKFQERTIGVVSLLGHYQAKYIQDLILHELGENVFERHKVSCGDPSSFQGKERDIIFLSMVIDRNKKSVLNKRSDEQRINVAMSRARDRMYLYRSIEAADLNERGLRVKVLQHFSDPMPCEIGTVDFVELCDSNFEREVFKKLTSLGYNVTPQVRVGAFSIDMVVEGENDRRLAVELDGDQYHGPEKWADDWRRQRILERVGWTFWRCWGSSYTLNPDGCIDDLVSVLDKMGIYPYQHRSSKSIYIEKRVYPLSSQTDREAESLLAAEESSVL